MPSIKTAHAGRFELASQDRRVLYEVVPPDVAAHISADTPASFALSDGELRCCERFSARRMRDFTAGRYCASEALRILGHGRICVPVGDSREPVWPEFLVGSIAHTKGIAGAIAASDSRYLGLGLDLERVRPMDNIAGQICTGGELGLRRQEPAFGEYLSVLFSAKEAVYKCIWPLVRRFVSFHEIELEIDRHGGRFRVTRRSAIDPVVERIRGTWAIAGNVVAAVAVLHATQNGI